MLFPVLCGFCAVQWSWFARVNVLCNLSRKKSREVASSLPGRFLIRRCLTLCNIMAVEPRIAKRYKFHHCCSFNNYWGKGMEGGEKNCLRSFFGWPEDRYFVQKMRFGASSSTSNKLLLVARHILATAPPPPPPENAFKTGSVKVTNSLSPPSIVNKVRTGSKSSQGT